jgi:hypothetical protein
MSKPKSKRDAIPPRPDMDPMLGDKTIALVEWLRDYAPEEFQKTYEGRETHLGYHPHQD